MKNDQGALDEGDRRPRNGGRTGGMAEHLARASNDTVSAIESLGLWSPSKTFLSDNAEVMRLFIRVVPLSLDQNMNFSLDG
jgi:hypothetical protein